MHHYDKRFRGSYPTKTRQEPLITALISAIEVGYTSTERERESEKIITPSPSLYVSICTFIWRLNTIHDLRVQLQTHYERRAVSSHHMETNSSKVER